MKCAQARPLFSPYLDGAVTGRQMGDLSRHLETCSACQQQYVSLRQTQQLLARVGPRKAPADLALPAGTRDYGLTSIVAGALMIWLCVRIKRLGDGAQGDRAAMQLFGWSIVYLFVLFAVLLIDDRLRGGLL